MNMLSPQTRLVFHDTAALDPTNRMLDPQSNTIDTTIFDTAAQPPRIRAARRRIKCFTHSVAPSALMSENPTPASSGELSPGSKGTL